MINHLSELSLKVKEKNKKIKKIILFGSLVDDSYTSTSDADLLIILTEDRSRFIDRIPEYLLLFSEALLPVDVFPYTEKELQAVPLAQRALAEGIVLA